MHVHTTEGSEARPDPAVIPALGDMLCAAELASRLGTEDTLRRERAFIPDRPVPFEHVWAPLLRVARRRVRRATGRVAYARLAGAAHAGLERALLGRIGDLATRTLYRAFVTARTAGAYATFVRTQLGGGLRHLLAEHPELARLLATLVADWVDATVELIERFTADAPAITKAFGHRQQLGKVVRVEAGLSDPHGGGRQVAILHPARGQPVVYKPRSLAPDAAYARVVAWLDRVLPADVPRPRALHVLDRGTHGWMEYAAPVPCADASAYGRYYERAGAVLCLVHVLRGGDLHSGNVIADSEFPMLIDLEMLCGPVPVEGAHSSAGLERCVLDTGLLPQVHVDGGGAGRIEAGIGRAHGTEAASGTIAGIVSGWVDVNTDRMRWGTRALTPVAGAHQPRLTVQGGGHRAPAPDVAAAVARGFRRTYETVRAHRAELLAADGPIAGFAGGTSRVLLRATSVYALLLRRTTHPTMLRDPRVRSAELDVLRRPYLRSAERPALWPALDAECEAMQRLDVPLFTVPADGTTLHAPGRGVVVPGYAERSGYAAVRCGVAGLDGGHLRRQLHHIRIAFAADAHRRASWPASRAEPPGEVSACGPTAALAEALQIATLLRAVSVRQGAGRALWFAHDMGGGQRRLGPAGYSLESGQAGIALFFAALARVLRGRGREPEADEATAWARAAARPACEMVERRSGVSRPRGPGLAVGWGGVAYALACAGCLTNDADARSAARVALGPLGRPRLRVRADVFLGAAGAVLGALAVHRATGDGGTLDVAADWGDVLLKHRRWGTSDGFGHGYAGVAAALLRLAARTGDGRYAPVAVRAALARPADGSASPLRAAREGSEIAGWCRGPPGSGLACVAALDSGLGTRAERLAWRSKLVDLAGRGATDDHGPWTLCCGALARVDLLLSAGAALGRPSLVRDARALAGRIVAAAVRRRSYAHPPHTEALVPGMLRGLAGTGYTLLRTVAPDVLPSVLLADMPGPVARGR